MGRGPKPAKGKGEPAVPRKPRKNGDSKVRDLEQRLAEALRDKAEALEQQTATSEILRVISSSPTDIQPVFDIIAANAARLCAARDAQVLRVEGAVLRLISAYGSPSMSSVRTMSRGHAVGRAVIDRQAIHVRDMAQAVADFPETSSPQHGVESLLAVPLLRGDVAVGVIRVSRTQIQPFTEQQITLLKTFADQAVIAIENVRLFNETKEALDRQTATSEILRVISSSPTDVQPVFETILARAVELCGAREGSLFRFDGELLHASAHHDVPVATREILSRDYPMPPSNGYMSGRAILAKRIVTIEDVLADERYESTAPHAGGFRSMVGVPLLRDGTPVGVIVIVRSEAGPFTDRQIDLLQTFADQAVIAIENVRLFTELQASNRELTTALDTQTATSDILRVISRSQTDVQPVFDAIVASAVRLLRGSSGGLTRVAGDQLALVALMSTDDAGDAALRAFYPRPLQSAPGMHILVIRDRAPLNVADAHTDPRLSETAQTIARARGIRSQVAVPLLRRDEAIGALTVNRPEPGGFTDAEIDLLQTFADQAVIAIENVRLFKELESANRDLAAASQHKSEFLANMSHELRTPLNAIIGFSEVLADRMFGELNEKQEEYSKDIHASGQHLLSLINDILDLSKIEAGRMELELTEFDLPAALDNALMLIRERAGRRSIALHTEIDTRLGQIQADERKVRQVVLNLLSNAIKFTPEGGRIEVGATPKDGFVEIAVSDTGIGIAPEDQEKVFEEFRQVGTAAKKIEGTGLGLTLCRKFVELHGGKIWVKSQLGEGSTFTFTIPVRRGD